MSTYRVGRSFEDSTVMHALPAVKDEARRIGDPVTVWKKGFNHWSLVLDRSTPGRTGIRAGYGGAVAEPLETALQRLS